MKWNCNIVKEMYDRVIRRKFGLLCKDDTSNETFYNSYLNRLDCEPVDLTCLKGTELPCSEQSNTNPNIVPCSIKITISYVITIVEGQVRYIFTSTVTNAESPYTLDWNIVGTDWIVISEVGNVLTLSPAFTSTLTTTEINVSVLDAFGCQAENSVIVTYLGGCTDINFENYDPNATFDNGTCQLSILDIATNWSCNPDDSAELCVTVSGGTPPYTVVGTVNGTIAVSGGILCGVLANGTNFSVYVIDSVGRVTLVQKGVIDCPFDCEFADIKDNYVVECLTDAFGNNTGEAEVTITPSGGNAPYTVVGSINGGPIGPFQYLGGGVWGPGQTVNHHDEITGTITDANGCFFNFDIEINCPVPEPGGGGVDNCESLAEAFSSAIFQVRLDITNVIFSGGGYRVFYDLSWTPTYIPPPFSSANIAVVTSTVTNLSLNLINQRQIPSLSVCNPCVNIGSLISNPQFRGDMSGNCIREIESQILALNVLLNFTITTDTIVCNLCKAVEFNLEYDQCNLPFTPVNQLTNISLSLC